jgi:formate hydrogenlyase subunit 3/multisubunit Na+/H+ antiporter MnhD subunit
MNLIQQTLLLAYRFILVSMLFRTSVWLTWVLIEVSLFIFVSFNFSLKRYFWQTSLMWYFLIQAGSSVLILLSLLIDNDNLFFMFIVLKLGGFPFYSWFQQVIPLINKMSFFLALTGQKLPVLIMVVTVTPRFNLIWGVLIINIIVGALHILNSRTQQHLLINSRVANNRWLVLGWATSFELGLCFFLIYRVTLALVLFRSNQVVTLARLFSIRALPPFPLFFAKLLILMALVEQSLRLNLPILFLISGVAMAYSYVNFVIKKAINTNRRVRVFF